MNKIWAAILLGLILIVSIFYLYTSQKKAPKEIPILFPQKTTFKVKPKKQESLIDSDKAKLLYQNLVVGDSEKSKNIKLLPEPEEVIKIDIKNKDVFAEISSNNIKESIFDETIKDYNTTGNEAGKSLNIKLIPDDSKHIKLHDILPRNNYHYALLGYYRSEQEAKNAWAIIKKKNKNLLKNKEYNINKVKKDNVMLYRLIQGPYNDFKKAKLLCRKINLGADKCMVIKD